MRGNKQKGFTLVELLMAIAIIGILANTVLASVGVSRAKARDAKRLATISEVQKALEIYYDVNQTYPATAPAGYAGGDAALQMLHANGFLQANLALSGDSYAYFGGIENMSPYTECTTVGGCHGYSLSVIFERDDHAGLQKDADARVTDGVGTLFDGNSIDCTGTASSPEVCFDVTPLQIQQ